MVEGCLWDDGVVPPRGLADRIPDRTDVAVIGGGYTGLSAARTLARHGAAVTVLERHRVGWGASGRNGGFVLPGFQPDAGCLTRRYGVSRARALFATSLEAVAFLERLIADESIACEYVRGGWVTLAARPGHLRDLERIRATLGEHFGHHTVLLGPADLREEIDSPCYHGGLLDPAAAACIRAGTAGVWRRRRSARERSSWKASRCSARPRPPGRSSSPPRAVRSRPLGLCWRRTATRGRSSRRSGGGWYPSAAMSWPPGGWIRRSHARCCPGPR